MNVPDAITPVEGYRAWGLGLGRLWSMRAPTPTPWPTSGPLRARCLKDRNPLVGRAEPVAGCHYAPSPGCSCGVYAAWEPWELESISLGPPFVLVVGRVWGWGRVVLGTRGWRAEYVQPVELFVAPWWSETTKAHVRRVADAYALPLAAWSVDVGRPPDRIAR